ncbi:putative gluconeogenesis factor [Streptococcus oralis]|nr:putative gluconeogenesis factor [Streptococcus oralis]
MVTNRIDDYLAQVEHAFAGLCKQVPRVISSNFLRLENGAAFHDGDLIVDELMRIIQVRK